MVDGASVRALIDSHRVSFASAWEHAHPQKPPLGMGAELEALLPEGGLPRGAIVELSATSGLGTSTSFALSACESAQAEGRQQRGESSWCAWIDADHTLYAPAVRARGVDLDRLLIVRPPRLAIGKTAVQLAQAHVFSVIVVDASGVPGASAARGLAPRTESLSIWVQIVRRLALSIEASKTIILLLTDADAPRPLAIPVAMRIELASEGRSSSRLRVVKERHGRVGGPHRVALLRGGRGQSSSNTSATSLVMGG